MDGSSSGFDLLEAAEDGDVTRVENLLRAGADPNIRDILHGGTALQSAAHQGNLELVRLLVRYGAEVNMSSGDVAHTALESAALAGRVEVAHWLLQAGATLPVGDALELLLADLAKWGEHGMTSLLTSWKRR